MANDEKVPRRLYRYQKLSSRTLEKSDLDPPGSGRSLHLRDIGYLYEIHACYMKHSLYEVAPAGTSPL